MNGHPCSRERPVYDTMNWEYNPFQELYLADSVQGEAFVDLFSPLPITSAINPVFLPGNVVLSGTQGCGKSMILQLFHPEIRIAYHDRKELFPVPESLHRFVTSSVHMIRSGICSLGQVTLGKTREYDLEYLPYYFGDFFNLLAMEGLLKNVERMLERPDVFKKILDPKRVSTFAEDIKNVDAWEGLYHHCTTFEQIRDTTKIRISEYRRWCNNPDQGVPKSLSASKTLISEPLAQVIESMRETGLLLKKVNTFVCLDQLEELHQQAGEYQRELREGFRKLLNKALASRDQRLHYKIGTRRYGWTPERLKVFDSGAILEAKRDYILIDIDVTLSKEEHQKSVFPEFASDAFCRRLRLTTMDETDSNEAEIVPKNILETCLGKTPSQAEKFNNYVQDNLNSELIRRMLRITNEEDWPDEWVSFLEELAHSTPLEAVLAAAWGRQKGTDKKLNRLNSPKKPYGWEKKWWRKERLTVASLQVAARNMQRFEWWGKNDVISLSSPNITAFLHLCHGIWDAFLKLEQLKDSPDERIHPFKGDVIPQKTQAAGIQKASRDWYDKLPEQPGGDIRKRFIDQLGRHFRDRLRSDGSISYPGANGFSVEVSVIEENPNLKEFLYDAVGYGDLVLKQHTTKSKKGEARIKFYLNPILSPVFQIPPAHMKEPLYWNLDDVVRIAKGANLPFASSMVVQMAEPKPAKVGEPKHDLVQDDWFPDV